MPHSTTATAIAASSEGKRLSFDSRPSMFERFPDHDESISTPGLNNQRWLPRIDSGITMDGPWKGRRHTGVSRHSRQPSLSDALKTMSSGHGSVTSNAHEIADALKAPVSPKLVSLCIIWYFSSALTNTSSKSILTTFPKPATLTLIQFVLVSAFCLFFSWLPKVFPALRNAIPSLRNGLQYPSRDIIRSTLPMAVFQIVGHLLSSTATAKIPVSLVHTIKGLSPLFTVLATRVFFNIRYGVWTYVSLIPLTIGVMLACSSSFFGNMTGILYAFLSTFTFVSQNIYSKQLFNAAARVEADGVSSRTTKLDKLNLLFYCSTQAFLLTIPIWFWGEGLTVISDFLHDGSLDLIKKPESFDHGRLFLEYIFNGTFHFGQNILAFVLLSMVSPVTYSVASLIKRVFVVVIAIIWFRNPTSKIQAFGIALTFFGLYLYDRTSSNSKADRKAKLLSTKSETLLPLNTRVSNVNGLNGINASPIQISARSLSPFSNGYGINTSQPNGSGKRDDDAVQNGSRPRGGSSAGWLPAGTKQENTWQLGDSQLSSNRVLVT